MDEKLTFGKDNKGVTNPRHLQRNVSFFFYQVKSKLNQQVAERLIQK